MTPAELKTSTALLGFTDTLSDLSDTAEAAFWAALNRALRQVDLLRPRHGTLFLRHTPPVNLADTPHFLVAEGEEKRIVCPGAEGYYFEARGRGSCRVESESGILTLRIVDEETPQVFSGRVTGALTLLFSADADLEVRDLGIYGEVEEEAPLVGGGACVGYDLSALAPDFAALSEPPARWDGTRYVSVPGGYYFEEYDRIYLERRLPGSYRIRYRRAVPTVDENWGDERELPLSPELCDLLPLCLAYYLLLDEEPAAAAEYRALYREHAAMLERAGNGGVPAAYESTNNW